MIIHSLGRQSDLIFAEFGGEILDRGNYTVIKTPSNPEYHWGNYIVFDQPPTKGCFKKWKSIFDQEFTYYQQSHHYVFTWDSTGDKQGYYREFLEASFELDSAVVLTAERLHPPPYFRETPEFKLKKISDDSGWEDVIHLQTLCADPRHLNKHYEAFKRNQMSQYRAMSLAGMGHWFGAYIGDQLVADLGIFFKNSIARYQNVGTHPKFRRQGICGSLVYQAGLRAMEDFPVDTLVMEADAEYHAARIYESVGFRRCEENFALSWWQGIGHH
ncbi:MAG: GNAT family N-acetyltransferase [Pseudobacteriovorax sp.]|nr:GNAT family N-acetyltransferase [Pseudobacteriovorax sp.]